ncbi:Na/Pi cotransporter family protein [Paenibacillus xylaniclasticus]|uniref:Na/Pi cotransporter family protein n=1 Tax=Paenibacillus xylaniclasticus TaxID=588083 RepID=UPI000FDCB6B9|nr:MULTISPECIES: Na/Pi symporter [Paenibacillus]GFN30325.1 Na/Pi-cotransporter [Paenibacillus curdlanolyticus]
MLHTIILPLTLGFAVFMTGMKLMEMALSRWAGPYLSSILRRFTATPLHGLATGTATTAVLQSSTAVTVLSIGLVNAGLMTFPRTLGIVLGTNIGTCLTTELIGLQIGRMAVPLLLTASAAWLLTAAAGEMRLIAWSRAEPVLLPVRLLAVASAGFALILLGITTMQSIGPAVQASSMFSWFIEQSKNSVLWGVAAGTLLTAAVHSSAAVIGIVMGMSAIGAMPLEVCVAVVLGANIGTCFTAVLAAISSTKAGRYVAISHVVLNVAGAALFLPLIPMLAHLSAAISESPAAQVAHAQTIFNIVCSLLALPLCYLPALRSPRLLH